MSSPAARNCRHRAIFRRTLGSPILWGGEEIDRYVITAIPAAPTKVAVVGATVGVRITWRDASANETSFKIQVSIDGAGFQTLDVVDANVTSAGDTPPLSSGKRSYRVRAINAYGASAWVVARSA